MSFRLEIVNLLRYQEAAIGVGCPAGEDELGAEDDIRGTSTGTRGAE